MKCVCVCIYVVISIWWWWVMVANEECHRDTDREKEKGRNDEKLDVCVCVPCPMWLCDYLCHTGKMSIIEWYKVINAILLRSLVIFAQINFRCYCWISSKWLSGQRLIWWETNWCWYYNVDGALFAVCPLIRFALILFHLNEC